MKKYTALLLASTMMLTALTGCGGAGGSDAQTQEADGPISL